MDPIRFGQYTLLRKIATGGTAEIFLARRHGVDGFARHLAIKRILPHLEEEQAFVQLLLDEARLAAHLHHGHVIPIYDVGVEDGQAYIAMEYLPGTDLGRLLRALKRRRRRVLVVSAEADRREALVAGLRAAVDAEVVGAADAEEAQARSSEGPLDLAVVEAGLVGPIRDPLLHMLQAAHPELMRVVLVGPASGRQHGAYAVCTQDPSPEAVGQLARRCLVPRLPLELVVQIVRAVADGLESAHSATDFEGKPLAIVHRDVNPSNVLVSVGGAVKLVDFGIARATSRARAEGRGNLVGTVNYMCPEQASGQDPDARGDLFSLGTLLYELAGGVHPYAGDNDFATMRAIREVTPPALDALVPGVPEPLVRLALRASCKEPAQRCASAADFLAELEDFVRRDGLNLSPKRLARFLEVVFDARERAAFGVSGTGYEPVHTPAVGLVPTRNGPGPRASRHEVEVDLEDLAVPEPAPRSGGPSRRHPVEDLAPGAAPEAPDPVRPRSDRLPRILLVAVVLALLGAGGWYWHWRGQQVQGEGVPGDIGAPAP